MQTDGLETRTLFTATAEELKQVTPDERALPVTALCGRISEPFTGENRKKLCYRELTEALVRMGLLEERTLDGGKKEIHPASLGLSVGISTEDRKSRTGSRTVLLYSPSAQRFILEHFDTVMKYIDEAREERRTARRGRGQNRTESAHEKTRKV